MNMQVRVSDARSWMETIRTSNVYSTSQRSARTPRSPRVNQKGGEWRQQPHHREADRQTAPRACGGAPPPPGVGLAE